MFPGTKNFKDIDLQPMPITSTQPTGNHSRPNFTPNLHYRPVHCSTPGNDEAFLSFKSTFLVQYPNTMLT